jgi:hypothetical protein
MATKKIKRFQEGGLSDKDAGLEASKDDKVGFLERLRMGNIDDPESEAYKRFGAGRGRAARIPVEDRVGTPAEEIRARETPAPAASSPSMTITDAINIIRGPKDGATNYFKQKTTAALINAFTPVVKSSLDKVDATRLYGDLITTYNNFPTTRNKLNPDLTSYVVGKAVDALFDQIAKEELEIRENPVKRTTEILKKVFGATWN